MRLEKPNLLVLYCGGAIGMQQNAETSTLESTLSSNDILAMIPYLSNEFDLDQVTITNQDSTNMQPAHWTRVCNAIFENYENYDGFVVIHGTDTMAYTATAVSFAIRNLGKPVVFTGSQIPPEILGSDAIQNLTNACKVASMDIAESCIVFGQYIYRANRSLKVSENDRNAFSSPAFPALGKIHTHPEIMYQNAYRRHGGHIENIGLFKGSIATIMIQPGMNPNICEALVKSGKINGLILQTFGAGHVPDSEQNWLPFIQQCHKTELPVVISSPSIFDVTRTFTYKTSQELIDSGALLAHDMTTEAAFVKLQWLFGQGKNYNEIRDLFSKDVAGELTY